MIYNSLGKSGIKVSALGFGTMRWQTEEECARIIHRGLDAGMNYIDTSSGYVDGKSVEWCGKAVKGRRKDVLFSSKADWAGDPSADAVRKSIDGLLRKSGLDYFDFYQVWGLQAMSSLRHILAKGGMVEGVRKAQKEGLIKHGLGFTFHGDAETFKTAIDSGEFLCATVSYNLLNRKEEELINYAAKNGVGVIIMNPLAGGMLTNAQDPSLKFLRHGQQGPWYGGLRFLLANKAISTAILGFSKLEEVDKNLSVLDSPQVSESYRQELIAEVAKAKLSGKVFCTGCRYCADCPNGFDPSYFMQSMRDFEVSGIKPAEVKNWISAKYMGSSPDEVLAKCIDCKLCEENCPQHLKITEEIGKAKGLFRIERV